MFRRKKEKASEAVEASKAPRPLHPDLQPPVLPPPTMVERRLRAVKHARGRDKSKDSTYQSIHSQVAKPAAPQPEPLSPDSMRARRAEALSKAKENAPPPAEKVFSLDAPGYIDPVSALGELGIYTDAFGTGDLGISAEGAFASVNESMSRLSRATEDMTIVLTSVEKEPTDVEHMDEYTSNSKNVEWHKSWDFTATDNDQNNDDAMNGDFNGDGGGGGGGGGDDASKGTESARKGSEREADSKQAAKGSGGEDKEAKKSDEDQPSDEFTHMVLNIMKQRGLYALKVGRSGPARRTRVRLSRDGSELTWKSKMKRRTKCRVRLENVSRVMNMQVSSNFARVNNSAFFRSWNVDPQHVQRSMSLTFDAGKRSLDLVILQDKVLAKRLVQLRDQKLRKAGLDPLKFAGGELDVANAIEEQKKKKTDDAAAGGVDAAAFLSPEELQQLTSANMEMLKVLEALKWLVDSKMQAHQKVNAEERFLRILFLEADEDGSGSISLSEMLQLASRLNLGRSEEEIEAELEALASSDGGSNNGQQGAAELNFEAFSELMAKLASTTDTSAVWAALCSNTLMPNASKNKTAKKKRNSIASTAATSASAVAPTKRIATATTGSALQASPLVIPSDSLHEFLVGSARDTLSDYAAKTVKVKAFRARFLAGVQRETAEAAAEMLVRHNLARPTRASLRAVAKQPLPPPPSTPGKDVTGTGAAAAAAAAGRTAALNDAPSTDTNEILSGIDDANRQPTAAAAAAGTADDDAILGGASVVAGEEKGTAAVASAGDDSGESSGSDSDSDSNGEDGDDGGKETIGAASASASGKEEDSKLRERKNTEKEKKKKKTRRKKSKLAPVDKKVFTSLLKDPDNTLLDPKCNSVYQDMTQPLSHYWCASSHNTYLTGDQLQSNSSVQRYIDDLCEGCRCVELDCWDDAVTGEPCIYHGGTMTSKISFRDVIEAVRDYGFVASQYPIILSFENHCSPPFQLKMAQHIKDVLLAAGILWLPPESKLNPSGPGPIATVLPSPEETKGFVLIKAKMGRFKKKAPKDAKTSAPVAMAAVAAPLPTIQPEKGSDDNREESTDSAAAATAAAATAAAATAAAAGEAGEALTGAFTASWGALVSGGGAAVGALAASGDDLLRATRDSTDFQVGGMFGGGGGGDGGNSSGGTESGSGKPRGGGAQHGDTAENEEDNIDELDDLVAIKGAKLKSWEKSTEAVEVDGIHSLKESKIEKQSRKYPAMLLKYLESRLIRIYPDNLRFDSSNYDPVASWNYGCQVVALNYQTPDLPMQLNRGRFRDNGNCGYVLRPPFLNPAPPASNGPALGGRRGSKMMGRKRNEMMIHELGGDGAGEEGVTRKRQQTLADDDEDGFASDYDMDNTDDDEENAAGAAGDGDESDSDREDEEKLEKSCKWMPPLDLQTYLATSPFATEAINLTVRIISVENIPDAAADAPSRTTSFASSTNDLATVEMEVHGAPCDRARFASAAPHASEGTKYIFDEAMTTPVGEPRLALLRFTVVKQGVAVAQAVLPVDRVRPGVRWVQLYDPLSMSDKVTQDFILTRLLVLVSCEPIQSKASAKEARRTRKSMGGFRRRRSAASSTKA